MRFISHHEVEWRLICDGVRAVVMGELHMGDLVGPGIQVRATEDLEICFNLLVDLFSFTVRLRVVGSGKGEVVV